MLFYSTLKGQGFVEYALIMLLVALLVIVVLALIGPYVGNMYSSVVGNI
jgi:pilus assembly protein Flp/PilA